MAQEANEAIASAVRTLSLHRLHLFLVIARTGFHCDAALTGGVDLDARLTAELVVTLCVSDSLNACASGIMVVRVERIDRAGATRADGGPIDVEQVDPVVARSRGIVVAVSESNGHIWLGAPNLPCRRVEHGELALLLRDLRGPRLR